jgi:hypothetical protein
VTRVPSANVSSVKANVAVATMPVPDVVRQATAPPVKVESRKLADGVWFLGGGTHHSMLVEFRDFVAVVEAPVNETSSTHTTISITLVGCAPTSPREPPS